MRWRTHLSLSLCVSVRTLSFPFVAIFVVEYFWIADHHTVLSFSLFLPSWRLSLLIFLISISLSSSFSESPTLLQLHPTLKVCIHSWLVVLSWWWCVFSGQCHTAILCWCLWPLGWLPIQKAWVLMTRARRVQLPLKRTTTRGNMRPLMMKVAMKKAPVSVGTWVRVPLLSPRMMMMTSTGRLNWVLSSLWKSSSRRTRLICFLLLLFLASLFWKIYALFTCVFVSHLCMCMLFSAWGL